MGIHVHNDNNRNRKMLEGRKPVQAKHLRNIHSISRKNAREGEWVEMASKTADLTEIQNEMLQFFQ